MNNSYYTNPGLSGTGMTSMPQMPINAGVSSELPMEQSYIENILRLNKGKIASFYMTFPDSNEWRDRIFTGAVEQAARDHFVVSDPKSGKWYLLPSIYLDFIFFDEEINYKVI